MTSKSRIIGCPYQPNRVEFPKAVSFGRTLFDALNVYSSQVALGFISTGELLTCETLLIKSEIIAKHLISRHKCKQGDVIALFASNCVEWVLLALAAFRVGAVLSPFNSHLKAAELKTHMHLSGANFIFTERSHIDVVIEASKNISLQAIIVKDGSVPGCVSFESLLAIGDNDCDSTPLPEFSELDARLSGNAIALVMFSSGTTGTQKAVMLTHTNLQASLAIGRQDRCKVLDTHTLTFLPFFTIYGLTTLLFSLACGYMTHCMSKFDLTTYLKSISQLKISHLLVVPPVAILLAKSPLVDQFDLSSVKVISSGGATLSAAVEQLLLDRLPSLHAVAQALGMTEATGAFCITDFMASPEKLRGNKRKISSAGVPMYNTEIKVIDLKNGEALGPNIDGEICVKSPAIMLGYAGNSQATAEAIDRDGWLHTGDVGHYDDDGYFYVVDRVKEMIKYNTYQVAPAELETILLSHEDVSDAAVVGLPDAKYGELPLAWVVRKPKATITEAQLQQFVSGKVASFKKLRGGVRFIESIPKTPSGKILRRELKSLLLQGKL